MSKLSLFNNIKRKAFERNEDALNAVRKMGILNENEINDVLGRLKDASAKLNDEPIVRLHHDKSLDDMMSNDGRLKSQFEAGRSSGTYDPSMRNFYEKETFGTHPRENPSEAAAYALAKDVDQELLKKDGYRYGANKVYLRPEVRYRATFNIGDSLSDRSKRHPSPYDMPGMGNLIYGDNVYEDMGISRYKRENRQELLNNGITSDDYTGVSDLADESKYNDAVMRQSWEWFTDLSREKDKSEKAYQKWKKEKLDSEKKQIYNTLERFESLLANNKAEDSWRIPYIEAQVFGGISPVDIQKVYTAKKNKLPEAWKATADKYGIRFEGPKGCYYNCVE